MMHAHGGVVVTSRTAGMDLRRCVAVPIDIGKSVAVVAVEDFTGTKLCRPFEFALNTEGVAAMLAAVTAVLPEGVQVVRAGVEACGHYHRPLVAPGVLPSQWEVVELNPAWVEAQRRVHGSVRRKTDAIDLDAIAELLRTGRGHPVAHRNDTLVELTGWVAHRRRRVQAAQMVRNQLTGQLDRAFPGLDRCLHRVLGTKVGCLVAAEFTDPARLATMGVTRFRRFAAARDVRVSTPTAERLVAAAKVAIPAADAAVARQVVSADLMLLDALDAQAAHAAEQIAALLPATAYAVLLTGPGWGPVRVGGYAAAVGQLHRWPSHRQIYRAAGLTPSQYESAGKRRDGAISREGNVLLREAVLQLGIGLRHHDRAAAARAAEMRQRGKPGGIITNAIARRANRIAFVMVRDQVPYDPTRWTPQE